MPQEVDVDAFMQQRRQPSPGADVNAIASASPANAPVAPDDIDAFMTARRQHEAVIRTAPVPPPELAVANAQLKGRIAAEVTAAQAHDLLQKTSADRLRSVQAQIPHELRGYTPEELAAPGNFQNPRTGQRSTVAGDLEAAGQPQGNAPTLNDLVTSPIQGVRNIASGAARIATGLTNEREDNGTLPGATQGMYGVPLPAPPMNRDIAGGASQVLGGGMQVAAPTLPGAIAAAPAATALGLGAGAAAQQGTESGLKAAGVADEYANLGGGLAGLAVGGLAAHGVGRAEPRTVAEEVPAVPVETTPPETPSEASKQTIDTQAQPSVQRGTSSPDVDAFMAARKAGATPDVDAFMAARTEPKQIAAAPEPAQPEVTPQTPPTPEIANQPEQIRTEAQSQAEPRGASVPGSATRVPVPGESTSYPGKYAVRELADVQPSHSGISFEPNPAYEHTNDRNYSKAENAERVVRQAGTFDPSYLLTDNPDAGNGPPIIDSRGNVLGGNSRAMTLQRIYENRPESAQSYKDLLEAKAPAFGIDRNAVRSMQQPVLVREADQIANPQQALTDFNKTGTAALTPSERAVSDSRRVSGDTLDYLAGKVAEEGETGTLATAMSGKNGPMTKLFELVVEGRNDRTVLPRLYNVINEWLPVYR